MLLALRHRLKQKPSLQFALISIAMLVALAAFACKPFSLDDPMYLWAARHIVHHPLDFYGFSVNWEGAAQPMSAVMKNPPLTSYYLALAGTLFGWSEPAIRLALIAVALFAAAGIYHL